MTERKRVWAAWVSAVAAAAVVAVAALPSTSAATPAGTQSVTANATLPCLIGADGYYAQVGITAAVTGTLPQTVNPGDALTLSNASVTFTTAPIPSTILAVLGSASVTGTLTALPLAVSGSSMVKVNMAAGGLPIAVSNIVGDQPITIPVPDGGPFDLSLGTVTGAPGTNVVVSLDTTPGFTGMTPTGNGIVVSLAGQSQLGAGQVAVVCTASAATLGAVAIGAAPTSNVTTTSTPAKTPTPQTTTTTPSTAGHAKPLTQKLAIAYRVAKSRLTLTVRVPVAARGLVTISYDAYRGRKRVAFASRRVKSHHGIAQTTFTLVGAIAGSNLAIHASASGATAVTVDVARPAVR